MANNYLSSSEQLSVLDKIQRFPLFYFFMIMVICAISIAMLYSAAGGHMQPWATSQIAFWGLGTVIMIVVAFIPPIWLRMLAWPMWFGTFISLILVLVIGVEGGNATRWLPLGPLRFQPSEVAKYTTVLFLAHVAQSLDWEESRKLRHWLLPLLAVLALFGLTLIQPDMGTALLIFAVAVIIVFLAGLHWGWFVLGLASLPVIIFGAWNFVFRDYQKQRVLTLFNPEFRPFRLGLSYYPIKN